MVKIRDKEVRTTLHHATLSGTRLPKIALPAYGDEGEVLKWLLKENVPGSFPFTAGVFAFKREYEDPTRMFAGEGDPSAPIGASTTSPRTPRPSACPPPSTR
ncbi:MAG: hypothetical protein KatS3mg123_3288 [Burkholderiales bacterium]|nr:MAG: hypothetical protein KatS3mg123_3288 [Burkholderiales bacterium]